MFEIRAEGGLVRVSGRLDASQAEKARAVLLAATESLTLDLSGLDYISSAGLGVIVEAYKRLLGLNLELKLVNVAPRVRTVFAYAGLDQVLSIE